MSKVKYGFVYIWFDRKHKRYYIGCHWGYVDDGYICSSRWMRQAYKRRPGDFRRRVLVSNIYSREETVVEENRWLGLIRGEELGRRYYNLVNRGYNHWSHDEIARCGVSQKVSQQNKGKRRSPSTEFKKGERRSKQTEFKQAHTPHNKGKTLEEVVGADKAKQMKKVKSTRLKESGHLPPIEKRFTKGTNLGKNNHRARAISTPFGIFDSIQQASQQTGVSKPSIQHRLKSEVHPEWQYHSL